MRVTVRVLGPVEVLVEDRPLSLSAGKAKTLLVLLVMHGHDGAGIGQLAEELWDGSPPPQATAALRVHICQLRKALRAAGAEERLRTIPGGYLLQFDAGEIDSDRFLRVAADGQAALQAREPARALSLLEQAGAMWRGEAFAGVERVAAIAAEHYILEEQRLLAVEARLDAELALGRHLRVLAELQRLTATHPLREGLWAQRMLALYRCGRQADALAVYEQVRIALAEHLGIDPSRPLTDLRTAILRQDTDLDCASLAPTAPGVPQARHLRRRRGSGLPDRQRGQRVALRARSARGWPDGLRDTVPGNPVSP